MLTGYAESIPEILKSGGDAGVVIEQKSADAFMANNCDLYTVGNLLQRSYALAFTRGELRWRKKCSFLRKYAE